MAWAIGKVEDEEKPALWDKENKGAEPRVAAKQAIQAKWSKVKGGGNGKVSLSVCWFNRAAEVWFLALSQQSCWSPAYCHYLLGALQDQCQETSGIENWPTRLACEPAATVWLMNGGYLPKCDSRACGPYLKPCVCETEIVWNSPQQPFLSIPEIKQTQWQKTGEAHLLAVSGIWMDWKLL